MHTIDWFVQCDLKTCMYSGPFQSNPEKAAATWNQVELFPDHKHGADLSGYTMVPDLGQMRFKIKKVTGKGRRAKVVLARADKDPTAELSTGVVFMNDVITNRTPMTYLGKPIRIVDTKKKRKPKK